MERVNHVHIVQVGRSSLIGNVDRVLQRQVPYRESLELSISGTDATFVLVVQLRQADSHLTRARTRSGDDDQLARSLHIIVLAEALIAGDEFHVVGIAIDEIVHIRLDAHALQAVAEQVGSLLAVIVSDDHRAHHELAVHELLAQTQHILIISDAQVGTHLVLLDVLGTDHDDDLQLVAQLGKHAQLRVGLEARQHARSVVVVKQFSSQLQIQFSVKLRDALFDML